MPNAGPLDIRMFTSPGFGENAYLVRCVATDARIAIDPGADVGPLVDAVDGDLDAIVLTHAHLDHIQGVAALVAATGAPVHLHPADRPLYENAPQQAAMFGLALGGLPPIDRALSDGQAFRFGDCTLDVHHVPGHAPGHVLLYSKAAECAFVGDVVFAGSIGRTDLPGGDFQTLMESIRERVLPLPDATVLYCGHGPSTTVRQERESNPFLIPLRGDRLA